ncbi:MAG TPA: dihydropteroate synthase [Chthoniobacterales bacterium]|nr:dihydropteroate synthase [Chthoniobacterales bacterium]
MIWRARDRLLTFERQAQLMAVLNITPDSFSDGGSFLEADHAVDQASRLVDEGAAILDVGGESSRPGSDPVSLEEELRRVIPVIRRLRREFPEVVLSIDTYKAETARQAVVAGADIINDITALRGDPLMVKVVKETGAGVVIMHMQGTPKTMQVAPYYRDVVAEVASFLDERRAFACAQGVAFDRIALDPGFGFGKRDQDNMRLIQRFDAIAALGSPTVVGISRKSTLARLSGEPQLPFSERLWPTIATTCLLRLGGAQVLRVHDVRPNLEALRMTEAIAVL